MNLAKLSPDIRCFQGRQLGRPACDSFCAFEVFFVGLLVGAVTIIADLAIAVILGVIVSALFFAWGHAKRIEVKISKNKKG